MLFNGRVVRVCAKVKRWRDGKGEAEKQKPESTFFEASTKLQLHPETKIAEAELRTPMLACEIRHHRAATALSLIGALRQLLCPIGQDMTRNANAYIRSPMRFLQYLSCYRICADLYTTNYHNGGPTTATASSPRGNPGTHSTTSGQTHPAGIRPASVSTMVQSDPILQETPRVPIPHSRPETPRESRAESLLHQPSME